jgi:hypothetical protein
MSTQRHQRSGRVAAERPKILCLAAPSFVAVLLIIAGVMAWPEQEFPVEHSEDSGSSNTVLNLGSGYPASSGRESSSNTTTPSGAYVQSFNIDGYYVDAIVKITRSGRHIVRVGYKQNGDWKYRLTIVGGVKAWTDYTVRGDAGDQIPIRMEIPSGGLSRTVYCEIVE